MPREVQRVAERLRGRQVGLAKALSRLESDPCHGSHYRLQGVLHPRLCGMHLGRGWRLAFSFLDEDPEGRTDTVVFDEEYVGGASKHEPCCEDELPTVNEDDVIALMQRLRSLDRRR